MKYDLGLIGIAVMGENLALNVVDNGYSVVVSSRKQKTVDAFLSGRAKDKKIHGTTNLLELVENLKKPRKILLMIKSGSPVDNVISQLLPILEKGDMIIDGGNSNYHDTIRRELHLKNHGIYFLGVGVSGGEEGALIGPSIMPGGSHDAWIHLKEMFQKISAKVDGVPCCDWLGENGSGHFVKMVHNGIEYGDIAIINEAYNILKNYLKLDNSRISEIFSDWNKSELDSYLIEITSDILKYKEKNGAFLVDNILDVAGQKGTGKWTVSSSLEHGVPLTLVSEAVFSRFLSSQKEERVKASKLFLEEKNSYVGDVTEFIDIVKRGVYLSKILSYTQGYALMRKASKFHNWNLDFGKIALLWRGGCIIRSVFLNKIHEAFERNPNLENLLFDSYFISEVKNNIYSLRQLVSHSSLAGIPIPSISSSLSYFDGYTSKVLPANLLQAQRDFFGAHTYERVDKPRGEFFHTDWTGKGGKTSSTTYNK